MKKIFIIFLIFSMGFMLYSWTGTTNDTAMYYANPERNGMYGTSGVPVFHGVKWQQKIKWKIFNPILSYKDIIVFHDEGGAIWLLSSKSGEIITTILTGSSNVNSGISVSNNSIIGTSYGTYSFDLMTSKQKWQGSSGGSTSPLIVNNAVFVCFHADHDDEAGGIVSFDFTTGKELWAYFIPVGHSVMNAAAYSNDILYFPATDGNLYAVNAEKGTLIWKSKMETDSTSKVPPLTGVPCVGDGRVYVTALPEGKKTAILFCFGGKTGNLLWKSSDYTNGNSTPAYHNGILFVGGGQEGGYSFSNESRGSIYALDGQTGKLIWKNDLGLGAVTTPSIAAGILYVSTTEGYIVALDEKSGKEVWRYNVGKPVTSAPVPGNGVIYFATVSGSIYALN